MKSASFSLIKVTAFVFVLLFSGMAYAADIAVIMNNGNTNDVNKTMIQKIYSGEMPAWPAGGGVAAFDLPEDSSDRATFTTALLGKSVSSVKALWAAKMFSGRATPPKVLGSDEDVKRAVSGNKNAIGYIKASSVDSSVKSVFTLH